MCGCPLRPLAIYAPDHTYTRTICNDIFRTIFWKSPLKFRLYHTSLGEIISMQNDSIYLCLINRFFNKLFGLNLVWTRNELLLPIKNQPKRKKQIAINPKENWLIIVYRWILKIATNPKSFQNPIKTNTWGKKSR